ncbi:hypothetical protein CEUSTIGMA_g11433.t1 [Chlamydomonas eustigma]|uniref:Uncharacterized protein n=1 Tax=Chlamydomonas eustigma TaxID=1157962 RepID=A0A250XLQ4_9CHLO|nr:hypothetical protein CEUSTIGMA_g11433.t1 [Chlamydomonas eustigma]|eukprot:GAX84008.1 hypothetical protein CEUSTIGMA_g11433.t1 [Chlamydomonas eustigma]
MFVKFDGTHILPSRSIRITSCYGSHYQQKIHNTCLLASYVQGLDASENRDCDDSRVTFSCSAVSYEQPDCQQACPAYYQQLGALISLSKNFQGDASSIVTPQSQSHTVTSSKPLVQHSPSVHVNEDATHTASIPSEDEEPLKAGAEILSEEAKRFLRDQLAAEQAQRTQALVDAAWQSLE